MAWRAFRGLNLWRRLAEVEARADLLERAVIGADVSYEMPPRYQVAFPLSPSVDLPMVDPPTVELDDGDDMWHQRFGNYL